MALDRDAILGLQDIKVKEIEVEAWGGSVFIRQLTRGQQDEYLKRQYGKLEVKQKGRTPEFETGVAFTIFGHDAWLFAQGVCDESGKRLFTDADVAKLEEKSGEAVGYVAKQIVEFSGMAQDIKELDELKN